MASTQSVVRQARVPHAHGLDENCPICEQPIPNDKAEAVRARMEAREIALSSAARAEAARQIEAERVQIKAAATAEIEQTRQEGAAALKKIMDDSADKESAARAEGKNEAAAELQPKLDALERAKSDLESASRERIAALERENQGALAEVEKERQKSADALKKAMDDSAAKESAARAAGKNEADAELQTKLSALERAKSDSEFASRERISELEQAVRTRDADWQAKLAILERENAEAQSAAQEHAAALHRETQGALAEVETLKADYEKTLNGRVQETRAAMEKDKTDALNAEKAKHAEETQKLSGKLEILTRQLENKTAEELGEGAEVKLFDALRTEFDGDRIERVSKGVSGADIVHTVIQNSRECGKIIYDSKNSTAWRDDYVSKLVQDQTAAKADYAILSTFKFPAGAKQMEVRDGVIIVNPARATVVAQLLRRQLVQVHSLRLSKSERAKKMAAVFDFITSARCGHLLGRIETHAGAALKLQEKEMKAHEAHWKQEGTLLRNIQKVKAELENEIDTIIGTHEPENDHEPV